MLRAALPDLDPMDTSVNEIFKILNFQIDSEYDFHRRYNEQAGNDVDDPDKVTSLSENAKLTPKEQVEKLMAEFVAD